MKVSVFGDRLFGQTLRILLAAVTLFIARAAWADTVVNNGRGFITTYDIGLMLLSGVGLMVFVARHRKKGGRDGDQ